MEYVERLLKNASFWEELDRIAGAEEERIYCRHDMDHFLAVARIMCLLYDGQRKEDGTEKTQSEASQTPGSYGNLWSHLYKETIWEQMYLTALLHDIGRSREYEEETPHEQASVQLAGHILQEIGYPKEWMVQVLGAIAGHRDKEKKPDFHTLEGLLREADTLSRNCFSCRAADSCSWPKERRNQTIVL